MYTMEQLAFQSLILSLIQEMKKDLQSTRQEFKEEFQSTRQEFKEELQKMRQEMKGEIQSTRQELKEEIRDVKLEVRDLRTEIRGDREKLDEVYLSRDKVKITFGWQWGLASFVIAIIAAGFARIIL